MKTHIVEITKKAEKDLKKLPKHIIIQFDVWVETIETDGYESMKKIKGYRDHALKGDKKGQRSTSLSKAYRVIYELRENKNVFIVEVQEVNKHEYKK
jgi:addiction module RelE/StbE family toxin